MMSETLMGLNPFQTITGCFFSNKKEKKDILLGEFIQKSWNDNFNNLSFINSISLTYQALVGNHQSFATANTDYQNQQEAKVETFKGVLDFLIIPLVARRLCNWSWLQMGNKNNSLSMELAISAARVFSLAVSVARILIGIALTITLTPFVGLICLLRQVNQPTTIGPLMTGQNLMLQTSNSAI